MFRNARAKIGLSRRDSRMLGLDPEGSEKTSVNPADPVNHMIAVNNGTGTANSAGPSQRPISSTGPAGPDQSRLQASKYQRCLALADEADGLADSVYKLRQKLSRKGALSKINNVRKIVGKSLRRLFHSMSLLKCKKYNIAPTTRRLRDKLDAHGNVVPFLDREGYHVFTRASRITDEKPFDPRKDYQRGFAH